MRKRGKKGNRIRVKKRVGEERGDEKGSKTECKEAEM